MRSAAEQEIRDAVVAKIRREMPDSRVVHELTVNTGSNRADVAAVMRDRLFLFEIKSEKDTLKRLKQQMRVFDDTAHNAFLVAHERWFHDDYRALLAAARWDHLWRHPEPVERLKRWAMPRLSMRQPHAFRFLDLLWRDELLEEVGRHRLQVGKRPNRQTMIEAMAWNLTGREIAHAVCRQLRGRHFAEADAPLFDSGRDVEAA